MNLFFEKRRVAPLSIQEVAHPVRELTRAVGDLFMPRTCLVCGRQLDLREQHLCLPCAADVPYTGYWRQAHNPMADRFNAVLEHRRGTEPMDYAYAVALLYYKGPYRAIPRAVKYHADLAAGRFFGNLLGRRIASAPFLADVDLILPVPLHWTRQWTRGYNQAEVLARAIAAAFSDTRRSDALSPSPECQDPTLSPSAPSSPSYPPTSTLPACRTDILVRARRTRSQTRLSIEEKARNVASAFQVRERRRGVRGDLDRYLYGSDSERRSRKNSVFNSKLLDSNLLCRRLFTDAPESVLAHARHLLLVDDTFTTGATLAACYAALRPYTSARISIATLAAVEGTPGGLPGSPTEGP